MSAEESHEGVIRKYKSVAGLHAFLGVGLLTCAIMGTLSAQEDESYTGPPFFIAGYLVGILNVLAALFSTCIVVNGGDKQLSDVEKRVGCAIRGHNVVVMLNPMVCLVGLFMVGSFFSFYDDYDRIDDDMSEIRNRNRIIAGTIIVGCVASALMTIFDMYITCTYSRVFRVKLSKSQ